MSRRRVPAHRVVYPFVLLALILPLFVVLPMWRSQASWRRPPRAAPATADLRGPDTLVPAAAPRKVGPCTPYAGGMILLPEGELASGDHGPSATVRMAPFLIGRTALTNAQYRLFLASTEAVYDTAVGGRNTLDAIAEEVRHIKPPADELDQPVRGISRGDLEAYAAWAGMHVASELELAYAARGPVDLAASRSDDGASWCGALHLADGAATGPPASVGARMAAWPEPGRDALAAILDRVRRAGVVREEWLNPERHAAAATRHWAPVGEAVEHHVHVLGPAATVVFVPAWSLLEQGSLAAYVAVWSEPTTLADRAALERTSASGLPPLLLGVLHSDIALADLDVLDPEGHPLSAPTPGGPQPPQVLGGGALAPATYVLAWWHGRVAVCDPAMEVLGFLPKTPWSACQVDVLHAQGRDLPPPQFIMDEDLDEVRLQHVLRLGGRHPDPDAWVALDLMIRFKGGHAWRATQGGRYPWQSHVPP